MKNFISNVNSVYSGPTGLLDSELMKMEAEAGYTCDMTLASLIQEALGDELHAEKVSARDFDLRASLIDVSKRN